MDKMQLKHEKKEMKMAKQANKHVTALRKIADGLEAMHNKLPAVAVVVKTKSKKK